MNKVAALVYTGTRYELASIVPLRFAGRVRLIPRAGGMPVLLAGIPVFFTWLDGTPPNFTDGQWAPQQWQTVTGANGEFSWPVPASEYGHYRWLVWVSNFQPGLVLLWFGAGPGGLTWSDSRISVVHYDNKHDEGSFGQNEWQFTEADYPTFEGWVVDQRTGQGIPNVRIKIDWWEGSGATQVWSNPGWEVLTGADGRFSWTVPNTEQEHDGWQLWTSKQLTGYRFMSFVGGPGSEVWEDANIAVVLYRNLKFR